jgi:hypothetical protein
MTQPESCVRMIERARANAAQLNSDTLMNGTPSADPNVELAARLLADSANDYGRAFQTPEHSRPEEFRAQSDAQAKTGKLVESRVQSIEISKLDDVLSRANYLLAQTDHKFSHQAGETWLGTRSEFDGRFHLGRGLGVAPTPVECLIRHDSHTQSQMPHLDHPYTQPTTFRPIEHRDKPQNQSNPMRFGSPSG